MSDHGLRLLEEALALPVNERADLVERLLSSLDPAEPEIEKLWTKEVEDRIDAFERGDLRTSQSCICIAPKSWRGRIPSDD